MVFFPFIYFCLLSSFAENGQYLRELVFSKTALQHNGETSDMEHVAPVSARALAHSTRQFHTPAPWSVKTKAMRSINQPGSLGPFIYPVLLNVGLVAFKLHSGLNISAHYAEKAMSREACDARMRFDASAWALEKPPGWFLIPIFVSWRAKTQIFWISGKTSACLKRISLDTFSPFLGYSAFVSP